MPLFNFSSFKETEFILGMQQKLHNLEQKILQIEKWLSSFDSSLKESMEKSYTSIVPNLMNLEKNLEKYFHSSKEETQKFKILTKEQEHELKNFHQTLENIELQLNYILKAFEILTNTQIDVIKDQLNILQKQSKQMDEKLEAWQYNTNNRFKDFTKKQEEIEQKSKTSMDRIWAPWRMELIRQPAPQGCFFCEYAKSDEDEKNLVLERGEYCFVVMNRYPYSNGHLMITPYKHTGDLNSLDIPTRSDIMEYTTRWQQILSQAVKAQGFNIGINVGKVAGAGVDDHIHIHIVPRWLGDTNFMTALGDTKVINQSLIELYHILRKTMS